MKPSFPFWANDTGVCVCVRVFCDCVLVCFILSISQYISKPVQECVNTSKEQNSPEQSRTVQNSPEQSRTVHTTSIATVGPIPNPTALRNLVDYTTLALSLALPPFISPSRVMFWPFLSSLFQMSEFPVSGWIFSQCEGLLSLWLCVCLQMCVCVCVLFLDSIQRTVCFQ